MKQKDERRQKRVISMGDHDQEISEQQDNLFYALARTILTRLKTLVEPLGRIPVQMRLKYIRRG
jgi:hypothetical protein